jgi:large subunit ribosomal protein L4
MKLNTISKTGAKGTVTVSDRLFAAKVNKTLLNQAVRVYLSNLRQGTSKTQTRGEVSRTKKKWFRQKGTGNARHGARSAPIFVGGGVAHGPKGNQNWSRKLTTSMKQRALISALSAQAENCFVIDEIEELNGKTKTAAELLKNVDYLNNRTLVVLPSRLPSVEQSLRNLQSVLVKSAADVNVLDVSAANIIVLTKVAIKALEERLQPTKKAAAQSQKATVEVETKAKTTAAKPKSAAKKASTTAKKSTAKKAEK